MNEKAPWESFAPIAQPSTPQSGQEDEIGRFLDRTTLGGAGAAIGAFGPAKKMGEAGLRRGAQVIQEGRVLGDLSAQQKIQQRMFGQTPPQTPAQAQGIVPKDQIPASSLQVPQAQRAQGFKSGAENYAMKFLSPIETERARSMQHAQELVKAAEAGEKALEARFPGQTTDLPSGLKVMNERMRAPRESVVFAPAETEAGPLTQAGKPVVEARALPPRVSPVAPPSGLDQVKALYQSMMQSAPVSALKSAAGAVGRYAVPPLAGYSVGTDIADILAEQGKSPEEIDRIKQILLGISGVAGAASMFPGPHQMATVPIGLGAMGAQAIRERARESQARPIPSLPAAP